MTNQCTTFEVATITHYEDTKDNQRCRNYGGFGSVQVIQGRREHNRSIERIQLPIRIL